MDVTEFRLGFQSGPRRSGTTQPGTGTGINTHYLPLTTLKTLSQLIVTTFSQ
ncbi:hypothetical protein PGTUg99_003291 [Puccinia graminis f. sp. tritici]|uniref:Uncharacterized protein n=1 Tax=Puccinia graminis f. sp. tritici TaxID=56615 RepID=A0A5B0RE39_PUCGR|nr:hypothetical protein PGTUg99_003291 [Puccinia graminis f. sp. tritici]